MLDSDRGHTDQTYEEHLAQKRFEEEMPTSAPRGPDSNGPGEPAKMPSPIGIGELVSGNPVLADPVIAGLLRLGETCNVIAAPKVGKSWLAYDLALSTSTGGEWLGRYRCDSGRVLLIDNELHTPTLANRIPTVARALDIPEQDYRDQLDVLSLRGRLVDLHGIRKLLHPLMDGTYSLVILDAWYRCIPSGVSENDNAPIAHLYNLVDQICGKLGCSWVNIHHASKGAQGDKAVTDVGSGAGSQSRAADTHIVLRPHEEDGIVVMDAAVRSFAPVEPMALRWEFPCWYQVDVDTTKLKGRLTKGEQRQSVKDTEGIEAIKAALEKGDNTCREIRRLAGGMGLSRCERLLGVLETNKTITSVETLRRGNTCRLYHLETDVVRGDVPRDVPRDHVA